MKRLDRLVVRAKSGIGLLASAFVFLFAITAHAADNSRWNEPAAELARRIADVLGPASAHLTIQNLSSISNDSVPAIRRLLEDGLKADGVAITNGDSANLLRVTLSENARGGLWVAEIVQGNQTRVVMAAVNEAPGSSLPATQKVMLHIQPIVKASDLQSKTGGQHDFGVSPILAAAQINNALVVLTSARVSVLQSSTGGWLELAHADLGAAHAASRDPRGVVVPLTDGNGFEAYAPGVACTGTFDAAAAGSPPGSWTAHCHTSDDPWPLVQSSADAGTKAFYNSGRNYFTGVIAPALAVELPPFYTAALLANRAAGSALLIGGVDGKVILVENSQIKPVAGTRDWGSDFAVVNSSCGVGAQVIVSSSGEGAADSLRSYELPAQEAVAVSEPLMLGGTAMGLWPAPDGKSAIVLVRKALEQGHGFDYEVDRVSQSCN
jgi:hypothetical protein